MQRASHLLRSLLVVAVAASGLTAVAAVAGPLSPASAAVTTPTKVISVERSTSVGAFLTAGGDV
jgi:hypothetical protein